MSNFLKKFIVGGMMVVMLLGWGSAVMAAPKAAAPSPTGNLVPCAPPNEKKMCVVLTNPLGTSATVLGATEIIGRVIAAVLGVIGAVALVIFLRGGSKLLMSMGNAEKIKEGTDAMKWAGIGMLLVLLSYIVMATTILFLRGQEAKVNTQTPIKALETIDQPAVPAGP